MIQVEDQEKIEEALRQGWCLADDLVAFEKAGIGTGFKPGVPRKMAKDAKAAYESFQSWRKEHG